MVKTEASKSIPKHWELVRDEQKDGKTSCYYICWATGQHFYSYEGLARYVKYAKAAEVSIYSQDFNADESRKSGKSRRQLPLLGEHSSADCQESAAVEKSSEVEKIIHFGMSDCAEGSTTGEVPASVCEPAIPSWTELEDKPASNQQGTGKVLLQYFRRFKGKKKLETMNTN